MQVTCQGCGQRVNVDESLLGMRVACPKCKTELQVPTAEPKPGATQEPPAQQQPVGHSPVGHAPLGQSPVGQPTAYAGGGFRCPFCGSTAPPRIGSEVGTAGIVTLVVLLLVCLPLFWIGLLIKDEYRACSQCGARIGQ